MLQLAVIPIILKLVAHERYMTCKTFQTLAPQKVCSGWSNKRIITYYCCVEVLVPDFQVTVM